MDPKKPVRAAKGAVETVAEKPAEMMEKPIRRHRTTLRHPDGCSDKLVGTCVR